MIDDDIAPYDRTKLIMRIILISLIIGIILHLWIIYKLMADDRHTLKAIDSIETKCDNQNAKDSSECMFFDIAVTNYEDPSRLLKTFKYKDKLCKLSSYELDNTINNVTVWLLRSNMRRDDAVDIINTGIGSLKAMDVLDPAYPYAR